VTRFLEWKKGTFQVLQCKKKAGHLKPEKGVGSVKINFEIIWAVCALYAIPVVQFNSHAWIF
jgi:hypothetical protein